MKSFITDRVEYLVSTFLKDGLTSKERDELKNYLKDKEVQGYFKECYQLWNTSLNANNEFRTDFAFQKIMFQFEIQSTKVKSLQKTSKAHLLRLSIIAASILAFILGIASYHFILSDKKSSTNYVLAKNRIIVPLGAKSQVELPDGTIVMLNAGSQLEYEMNYGERIREVLLEGEGYFKVAKNKECAFVVNANNVLIKALGTEFNVKAYPDEEFVQTTLVEGSVSINLNSNTEDKLNDIILRPNQMATILRNSNSVVDINDNKAIANESEYLNTIPLDKQPDKDSQISMETVKTILYTSWKDSRWVIEGESMEELAQKLQRRYDVTISINDESLKKYKFSGILEDETLEQMLEIMKTIAPIEYTINKKQVNLKTNQRQRKSYEDSMN